MKVKLDEGAFLPVRGHATDAGLDIRSREDCMVRAGESWTFHTGVHVAIPENHCGLLVSKSGLNVLHDIVSTGLIDETYSGEIVVKLFNHGRDDYHVRRGDKISQLVILPCEYVTVELVDELEAYGRKDAGFGSTGR